MARSPCFLKNVWKLSLSKGIISIPRGAGLKPHTPIFQPGTIRYRDIYTRPFIGRHPSVHPLCTTACLGVKRLVAQRGYIMFSRSRIRSVGSTILTVSLVGAIIYIGFVASEVWYFFHPPQLSDWPEEVRKSVVQANVAARVGSKEAALDNLERAWIAVQTIPMHTFNPDSLVKVMRVAIWFANALEICGQPHRAYKVLCDAIGLHQAQSEKYSSTSADIASPGLDPAILTLKRHLITLYAKLASLSEKCDPTSEGKWMSHAIRETFVLLPLLPTIPLEHYAAIIQFVETFSTDDSCFSGLVSELTSQFTELATHPKSKQTNNEPTEIPNFSIKDVIADEEAFRFPTWYLPDIPSAIAMLYERIGLYAERHGHLDVASAAYVEAVKTVSDMFCPIPSAKEATITYWKHIVRLCRLSHRTAELFLHQVELETDPTEWLHTLHNAYKMISAAEQLVLDLFAIFKEKKKVWTSPRVWLKFAVTEKEWEAECAKSSVFVAMYFEKLGNMSGAISCCEDALTLLRSRQHPAEEIKKVEDQIEVLQQSMAKGKTTIESHMNPLALKAWEEMKTVESKAPEEAHVPASSDA